MFTSIPLAIDLLGNHRLTCVGTLRRNKVEIPPQFLGNKIRPQYSTLFGFTNKMTLGSYVPKKK